MNSIKKETNNNRDKIKAKLLDKTCTDCYWCGTIKMDFQEHAICLCQENRDKYELFLAKELCDNFIFAHKKTRKAYEKRTEGY